MRLLMIAGLAMAVTACSYQLWLRLDGDLAAPRIAITAPRIMQPKTCLERLWVSKASDPGNRLWEVSAEPNVCAPGSQIIYGQLPSGFTEKSEARTLEPGVLYEAVAVSRGVSGSIDFIYLEGGWKVVAEP